MGDPRARTLAHLQHLLAAAAVGASVSSCSKEEVRPDSADVAESAKPSETAVAAEPTAEPSAIDAGAPDAAGTGVASGPVDGGAADAGKDAGRAVIKPTPPPPTGYRVVDPLPPPTSRKNRNDPGF